MAIEGLRTPVGRIVWGNPAKPIQKRDQRTKQPILKDGKPVEQWAFGVAFSKAEFNAYLKPYFDQEAMSAYPHGVPQGFSWKYKDGDGVDRNGKPYSTREGYAGCIVLNISTEAFAPPIFKHVNGAYYQCSPDEIKTGDYVVLNLNIKVNVPTNPTHTPGLYVNPNGIELVGQGQAIINSANPDDMFGGQQHQLPPGATPLGAAPQPQQPMPGQPGAPAPGAVPGQPGLPPPAHDFVQPQQPMPGYPAQPAPQPQQPMPGYPAQPAPQPQQPMPGYPAQPAPQPQQPMPGLPGPR